MSFKKIDLGFVKQKYHQIPETFRPLLTMGLLLGLILLFKVFTHEQKPVDSKAPVINSSIDTVIPAGFVLVPVEISNIESIAPLLNGKAVIDLFKISEKGQAKKVAQRVKVLQAPNNPSMYAALVLENESEILMRYQGPFYAAIQNEKVKGSLVPGADRPARKISITYSP